jgi:hypothetical protein
LTPTSVKSSDHSPSAGDLVPVDASNGSVTITLPEAPADGSQVAIKTIAIAGAHRVTLACGGSDVVNRSGGSTSLDFSSLNAGGLMQYHAGSGIWYDSGRLAVANETLDACNAGFLRPDSADDQSAGMQAFLNAIGDAIGGAGGRGVIPPGLYHMGSTQLTYPNAPCIIEGSAPVSYALTDQTGTVLVWDHDVSGPPHAKYGLTIGGGMHVLRNVILSGPAAGYPGEYGGLRCALGGINASSGVSLENIAVNQWSTGVGWGGNGNPYDHCIADRVLASNVGYGFHFLPNSTGAGDCHFRHCRLDTDLAGVAVAQSASGIGGTSWIGCGLLGPFGFYRYGDGSINQGDFIDATALIATSTETASHAAIYDELWQDGTVGGFIQHSLFTFGLAFNAPNPSGATVWAKQFNVTAGSGNQIAVRDGSGFVFRPGMTVTGSGFAADTVIAAVAGTWPWTSATLTINNPPSGSPSTARISQPFIAGMVAFTILNNDFLNVVPPTSYPVLGGSYVALNRVTDAGGAYGEAGQHPLVVCPGGNCVGNTYGRLDAGQCFGTCGRDDDINAGDVLMMKNGSGGHAIRCDGTRKPFGVSLRTVSGPPGALDYAVRANSDVGNQDIPVNNYGSATIAANALVKVDTVNPGGVTTASSLADGPAIGVNGPNPLAPGTSGTLGELWL